MADVTITYMKGDGTTDTQAVNVKANSRETVNVKDKLGEENDKAHDFSAKVVCTNGKAIIAERPMYFNYNGVWTGGHDVMGFIPQQVPGAAAKTDILGLQGFFPRTDN